MDIEKLKQKILDLAIRGKLVPQDPNDEPASVLIEKIRKEKEELIKQGKIKRDKTESYIYKGSDNCYYEKIGNEVKSINDELPFEIPANWTWCRLGNVFDIGSSKRVHKADWKNTGIPFYRARDIELLNDGIFKSDLYISYDFYNEIKEKYGIPKINDILITAVGTLGKTYIIKDNNPFYYKDGNIICLSNSWDINPYFIQLLFQSSFLKKHLAKTEGTTVNTYTIINANKTLIPLPPINEQNKIVDSFSLFDKKIKNISLESKSINNLISKIKNKVLDFYYGENSCYKSYYKKVPLYSVCKLEKKDISNNGLLPYLEAKVIRGTKNPIFKNEGMFIAKGTLIILVDGENSGEVMVVPFNGYMGSTFRILHFNNDVINQDYLSFFILYNKQNLKDNKTGSAIPHLNKKIFNSLSLILPDINKQKSIVHKISLIFDILDKLINS